MKGNIRLERVMVINNFELQESISFFTATASKLQKSPSLIHHC